MRRNSPPPPPSSSSSSSSSSSPVAALSQKDKRLPSCLITDYSQQDATFLEFISADALHVSAGSSACHQEHITIYSFKYCQPIMLLAATVDKMQQYWLTIPEAVCRVMCS
jgi:hypothetical protein